MNRLRLIGLAALAVFTFAAATVTLAENDANPIEDQLRELMTQKRDVLQERVDQFEHFYLAGTASIEDVHNAKALLIDAKLELATSKDERLSILDSQVQLYREWEQALASQHAQGNVASAEVLKAKAARLDAEIALLREKL